MDIFRIFDSLNYIDNLLFGIGERSVAQHGPAWHRWYILAQHLSPGIQGSWHAGVEGCAYG